mgnify:CR=1 FL=1
MKQIRQPIVTLVGHVDHGKSSILDFIRGSSIVKHEAGGITQCISTTNVPILNVKKITSGLLEKLKINITIPGLLFIDTPGHRAFTNLRKRGGNLADIAILVIDINQGIEQQTLEAIDILKHYKTPFIIVANKIDLISGWRTNKGFLIENINKQAEQVRNLLDRRIYELVGRFSEMGFNSERFDRVEDYRKQLAIVPVSAKTGEGIPELLMVITGLAQKYLEEELKINVTGEAKGIILEITEEVGLGKSLDVIIYDGTLKINDQIVIAGLDKAIVTKVKALLEPEPLSDLRLCKFNTVKEVHAASGLRINALNIEEALSGMPLAVANKNLDKIKKEIQKEVEEVLIETDKEGVIIKADSLGSLEALINLLKEKDIKIKKASIGNINKKDISEALAEKNKVNRVILGFNVELKENSKDVKVITHDVIYQIIEDYDDWLRKENKEFVNKKLDKLTRPCKIVVLPGYVFRNSGPAIVGVEVLGGTLKQGINLFRGNSVISKVKELQLEGKNVNEAEKGKKLAVSLPDAVFGRNLLDRDILYSEITENDFRELKKLKDYLSQDEIEVLKEISEIKRKNNAMWGI